MIFGNKILDYWDDILRDLGTLVAIPSVCGPADGKYPYGKEPARALDTALALARSYGLETQNVDYYAGHAQYGEGDENAIVMAHLDVVPAGEGWDTDPFQMVEKDGLLFGRGVSDNKGPAIIALHCLRALKEAGIKGNRKLRVVFGSGEEIGMDDMTHYFAKEQHPTMGFTPDGRYGICHCEKGLLRFQVSGEASPIISHFEAGTVVNAVPYKASALLQCTSQDTDLLRQKISSIPAFSLEERPEGLFILSQGKAAHASSPENGVNAAANLIELLYSVFDTRLGSFFTWIHDAIGLTYDGSLYGVSCADEVSGPLTFNLGLVHADAEGANFTVDIRYPATQKGSDIIAILRERTEKAGLLFHLLYNDEPLYLPKESSLIRLLSGAYEDITGMPCILYSMGGGTYARQMFGKGVAFGASFPGFSSHAHDCNERASIENLKLHAQICLEAMYRMFISE